MLAARRGHESNVAHHIQIVAARDSSSISIYQGNASPSIHWPLTWINKVFLRNPADPQSNAYGGMKIERSQYSKSKDGWNYKNLDTGVKITDLLKEFMFYRWNFHEFNR